MIDYDLESLYSTIMNAVLPEDVFGCVDIVLPPNELLKYLAEEYNSRKQKLNPDNFSEIEEQEIAKEAINYLNNFYLDAQNKIQGGTYGLNANRLFKPNDNFFCINERKYYLGKILSTGDISTIYQGFFDNGRGNFAEVIIKVVDSPEDNDLMQNEVRILRRLHAETVPQWKHLPFILDSFNTNDGRTGIVLRRFNGYTLLQVRAHKRYIKCVDRKHVVWMLNRLLSGIGYAHSLGIVHCNIEPSHLIINPAMHNLCILDWSYAAYLPSQTGDGFKVYTPNFSAPEVKQKKPPIPASDIYSIGKVMIWLLGGNIETNQMPGSVEEELQRFLQYLVRESPLQRPQNAWELHGQLISTVEKLWGKRKFLSFIMD
ncbi:MAG: serine/threonine protein kinase [Candidatus Nanoarchaeia archaeon]